MTGAWAELMLQLRFAWARARGGVGPWTIAGTLVWLLALLAGLFVLTLVGAFAALAPQLALTLTGALVVLAALGSLLYVIAPSAPIWVRGCLMVVVAHLLFNYGFGNASVGAGSARVPVSELVLVLSLVACAGYFWRKGFSQMPLGIWLLLSWLVLVLALHLPAGVARYGVPALRDALPSVQAFYLVPGFCIGRLVLEDAGRRQWIWRFLLVLGLCTAVYGTLYPMQKALLGMSPRIMGMQQAIPLVGYYSSWPTVAVTGMFGVLLWRWAQPPGKAGLLPTALALAVFSGFGLSFLLVQSRGGYVMLLAAIALLAVMRSQRKTVLRLGGALLAGVLVLLAVGESGLEIKGRIGRVSLDSVFAHVQTLGGQAEQGSGLEGAAAGIDQRRRWRELSLQLWSKDWASMVFGVGFGPALTDFSARGTDGRAVVVREPHNSYVTILTRTGILGLSAMLMFFASTFVAAVALYRQQLASGDKPLAALALGAAVFFLCNFLNALGQPNFEAPHFVAPFFFVSGIVLALGRSGRQVPHG